eukprot:51148-Eustigmatos_ZCMA.PRE.1
MARTGQRTRHMGATRSSVLPESSCTGSLMGKLRPGVHQPPMHCCCNPMIYGRYKTLAMIKPYTADVHHETIKSIILAHGFDVSAELHTQLTRERACEFYAEHDGKPFFERL